MLDNIINMLSKVNFIISVRVAITRNQIFFTVISVKNAILGQNNIHIIVSIVRNAILKKSSKMYFTVINANNVMHVKKKIFSTANIVYDAI